MALQHQSKWHQIADGTLAPGVAVQGQYLIVDLCATPQQALQVLTTSLPQALQIVHNAATIAAQPAQPHYGQQPYGGHGGAGTGGGPSVGAAMSAAGFGTSAPASESGAGELQEIGMMPAWSRSRTSVGGQDLSSESPGVDAAAEEALSHMGGSSLVPGRTLGGQTGPSAFFDAEATENALPARHAATVANAAAAGGPPEYQSSEEFWAAPTQQQQQQQQQQWHQQMQHQQMQHQQMQPQMQHPQMQHPQMQHPQMQYQQMQHPQMQHPQMQHQQVQHQQVQHHQQHSQQHWNQQRLAAAGAQSRPGMFS